MRCTDSRYEGEMAKFSLAVRMIGHEARTGTIRACTGFSEDRIRKIYGTYFREPGKTTVKRRRGKSPSRINTFVNTATRQSEATVLACMFIHCGLARLETSNGLLERQPLDALATGERVCDAFETYLAVHPHPAICFERAWNLFRSLVMEKELFFARCNECGGPYVQDRYALDYAHCPFCDIKQAAQGCKQMARSQ